MTHPPFHEQLRIPLVPVASQIAFQSGVIHAYAPSTVTVFFANYLTMTPIRDSPPRGLSGMTGFVRTRCPRGSASQPVTRIYPPPFVLTSLLTHSAFQSVPTPQIPPHRRITQDDAPSMMPLPAQNTSHQAGHAAHGGPFAQTQSKPGSSASFASLSGGGPYAGQGNSGNGTHGPTRKKARMG